MKSLISMLCLVLAVGAMAGPKKQKLSPARCEGLGDSVAQPEVEGRYQWSRKCKPAYETYYTVYEDLRGDGHGGAMYPTFGVFDADGNPTNPDKKRAGVSTSDSCDLIPARYELTGACESGCYTPDQGILFPEGYRPIGEAEERDLTSIVTLTSTSMFDKLRTQNSSVGHFTKDIVETKQDILVFRTESGAQVKVTLNHPMVDGEGRMRPASDMKVGESLVRIDGTKDPISSIDKQQYFGKVYNVSVASADPMENVVVAEGFLMGSLRYQNEWIGKLNRALLRDVLPVDTF